MANVNGMFEFNAISHGIVSSNNIWISDGWYASQHMDAVKIKINNLFWNVHETGKIHVRGLGVKPGLDKKGVYLMLVEDAYQFEQCRNFHCLIAEGFP